MSYQLVKPSTALKLLGNQKKLAIDTETTGLNWWNEKLVYISMSPAKGESYLIKYEPHMPEIETILSNPRIEKCFHKAAFDDLFLRKHNLPVANITFDTKIAAYNYNNLIDNSLKPFALRHLHVPEVTEFKDLLPKQPRRKKGEPVRPEPTILDVPLDKVIDYACADADYTKQAWDLLEPKMAEHGREKPFQLDMKVNEVLTTMMWNGCKIDVEAIEKIRVNVQRELDTEEKCIRKYLGNEINFGSGQQLAEKFYVEKSKDFPDSLGLPVPGHSKNKATRKSGAASTDSRCLGFLKDQHPSIPHILAWRKLDKLLGTYLEPIPSWLDNKNILHAWFNQCVTDTSRLSSSSPNLQNIPIRTENGKLLRKCWKSRFPGGKILVCDYSQIEVRVLGHLSKDPVLIKGIKAGMDFHKLTATLLYDVKLDAVTPAMRSFCKTLNFGVIFGMGATKLSVDGDVEFEEATGYIDTFFNNYKGVAKYKEEKKLFADANGYVETILGRRLHIEPWKNFGTTSMNYPIQGSASEIIKMAAVEVFKWMMREKLGSLMISQVHDELVFDVPAEEQELMLKTVPEIMKSVVTLSVPIDVSAYMVDSWGDAEK